MLESDSEPRKIVNLLISARKAKGVTQVQIAKLIGCGQPRISKIENGYDEQLRVHDIQDYATALEQTISLKFESDPSKSTESSPSSSKPKQTRSKPKKEPVAAEPDSDLPSYLL
ncbi:helix-turn-helix transcriptional regulator [Puniceicoccaceae bacterium K14]|nr:helix-turn-helix transcriptional regulator [Puniceicoccaceae bacterium K14]